MECAVLEGVQLDGFDGGREGGGEGEGGARADWVGEGEEGAEGVFECGGDGEEGSCEAREEREEESGEDE